jgi:hypothetical protein
MTRPDKAQPSPGQTQELGDALDSIAKNLKGLAGTVRRAVKGQMPPSKALPLLEQGHSILEEATTLRESLNSLIMGLNESQGRGWLELEARLKDLCVRRNWRIDGSWPSFIIEYGVQVNCDEKARFVHVGSTKIAGAQIAPIEAELNKRISSLVPRDFQTERFLEDLFNAYKDSRNAGTQVPVQDVYRNLVIRSQRSEFWRNALQGKFFEVTIEQFRARLCRVLDAGKVMTKGGDELRLYPPLDPKEGVFLYNPVDRRLGFIGRIEFVKGG